MSLFECYFIIEVASLYS